MSHNQSHQQAPIVSNNLFSNTNLSRNATQHDRNNRLNKVPLHLIYDPPHRPIVRSFLNLLDRLSALSPARAVELYISRSNPPSSTSRNVHVNLELPENAFLVSDRRRLRWLSSRKSNKLVNPDWIFPSNQIRTAKYSLLSFIPKNLFEQFRRVANVFFLVLVILQFFPKFSQTSPFLSALPLFFVLAITACKDGYEDIRRHQADRKTNAQPTLVLDPSVYSNPHHSRPIKNLSGPTFKKPNSPQSSSSSSDHETADILSPPSSAQQNSSSPSISTPPPWCAPYRQVSRTSTSFVHSRPKPVPKENSSSRDIQSFKDEDQFFKKAKWDSLRVGDYVKVLNNQAVPADILICSSSDSEENVCFIETKNLDGETNLKSRHGLSQLNFIRSYRDCIEKRQDHMSEFIIECEAPDPDLYSYRAALVFPKVPKESLSDEPLKVPVDLNSILLRGTVVRNTEWVIGVVVMTGVDTKIMLNSSATPSKRSKVERQMNPMVFINLTILALMCVFNAIGTHFFEKYYYERNSYWSYGSDLSGDNPNVNGAIGFVFAMITYQNIVPISLYISIEFVRTVQAYYIWADDKLMVNGLRTIARSWNLSDDLGQIQYVFSDKTGTLTQNLMQFRQCSIGGKVYRGTSTNDEEEGEKEIGSGLNISSQQNQSKVSPLEKSREEGGLKPLIRVPTPQLQPVLEPFKDSVLDEDLNNSNSDQSRMIHGFFATLALCHTVLASEDESGRLVYKAQSPDEAALVQTAADVGFVFRGRDKNVIRLEVPKSFDRVSEINEYELLEVIEFTSSRKRMSVILKRIETGEDTDPGGDSSTSEEIYLLVKGADSVIFDRLEPGQESIKATTDQQLEDFANEGLRTLCLAYRKLDRAEFNSWQVRYQHVSASLASDRDQKVELVQDELERDLILLGATAIEDKLQDGVPESIQELKQAGIKVWVATGDKLETAVAIGRTCNLITPDMNLIVVRGGAYGTKASAYEQIRRALVDFFDGAELVNNLRCLPPDHDERLKSQTMFRNLSSQNQDDLQSIVGMDNGSRGGGYGLVIDGSSLKHSMEESFTKEALLELSTRCVSVVCCRTSPKQKSEIVRLVKDGFKNKVQTLAIGDGANDVSMIQTADIGVGVQGEEGLQAVNSSDYAIAQFRLLNRLLLVHGHWSYEIIGISVLFFYQFWCGYSTTTLYEYTYLLFYNVFWSLLPVIGIGIFEQDVRERVLSRVPELYSIGRQSKLFTLWKFALYMFEGIYQGFIIYILIIFAYNTTTAREDGYSVGMSEFSTVIIVAVVLVLNLFNGLDQSIWNYWLLFAVLLGQVLILLYTAVYSAISPGWLWTEVYGNNHYLWQAAYWWFGNLIAIAAALLPKLAYKYIQAIYYPSDVQILRYFDSLNPNHNYEKDERIRINKLGSIKSSSSLPLPETGVMEIVEGSSGAENVGRTQGATLSQFKRRKSVLRERPLSVRLANLHTVFGSLTTSNKKGRGKPAIREGSCLRRTVEISDEREEGVEDEEEDEESNACNGERSREANNSSLAKRISGFFHPTTQSNNHASARDSQE
ncbi:putative aminophspholipid translocase [Phakopsora pachyrhizi]|uniref:Phospholipid-transporting ATPase n=1 Tax=Phakopsora pachyrhizi TaxID=170000 RepID=A0AAV0BAK1_PHAPC|nr:putative aminophspholipid translocase [Phakopsora pachyrhizi]